MFAALVGGAAVGAQFGPWWEAHTLSDGHLTVHLDMAGAPTLSGPLICTTRVDSADIEAVVADDIGMLGGERVGAAISPHPPWSSSDLDFRITKEVYLPVVFDTVTDDSGSTLSNGGLPFGRHPSGRLYEVSLPSGIAGGTVAWECWP